jgi:hypothetical protein
MTNTINYFKFYACGHYWIIDLTTLKVRRAS